MTEGFAFREAIRPTEDAEILSVYNCAHQRALSMDWFKWFNYHCPNGENRLFVAEDEAQSRIAAVWGMLPDRKSTRLNSSHIPLARMPSSA